MVSKGVIGAALATVLLGSTAVHARQSALVLEGAYLSLSADVAGESPPGSALQHDLSLDGGDPAFGLSFETRVTRHVGIRVGVLRGGVPLRGRTVCPNPTCDFTIGAVRVSISGGERTVEDDADLLALFLEVPIVFQPRPNVELFAGPTIASIDLDGAESPGPTGLALDVDTSSPAYGLHVGGAVHFGGRRGPGRPGPAWTAGVVARWIPLDVELGVRLPLGGAIGTLLSEEVEADLVSVGFMVGRRFGRSNR